MNTMREFIAEMEPVVNLVVKVSVIVVIPWYVTFGTFPMDLLAVCIVMSLSCVLPSRRRLK
jgi:hypothetical protein